MAPQLPSWLPRHVMIFSDQDLDGHHIAGGPREWVEVVRLLMEKNRVITSWGGVVFHHYEQGFIHPRWLAGFPSTVSRVRHVNGVKVPYFWAWEKTPAPAVGQIWTFLRCFWNTFNFVHSFYPGGCFVYCLCFIPTRGHDASWPISFSKLGENHHLFFFTLSSWRTSGRITRQGSCKK